MHFRVRVVTAHDVLLSEMNERTAADAKHARLCESKHVLYECAASVQRQASDQLPYSLVRQTCWLDDVSTTPLLPPIDSDGVKILEFLQTAQLDVAFIRVDRPEE